MLAPITDFKQKITLIAESGIQFLDFAICLNDSQPRNFVRQTANGPLLKCWKRSPSMLPSIFRHTRHNCQTGR